MMSRTKSPLNRWLLLALPVAGAVVWAIRRLVGPWNSEPHGAYPIGEQRRGMATQRIVPALPEPGRREVPAGHALSSQPRSPSIFYVLLVPFLILATAVIMLAFYRIPVQSRSIVPDGDPQRGQVALQSWGCGACHTIPGVPGATGQVGPALKEISNRSYIAGRLQNSPDQMIQWIMHPQEISPGVDMPDTGVPEKDARDMAAYLYSIR